MTKCSYQRDKAGTRAFLQSDEVGAVMADYAQRAAAYARSIAPVRSGHYRDNIEVRTETVDVFGESRAGAVLEAGAEYSAAVEAQHNVLHRTADAMKGGKI